MNDRAKMHAVIEWSDSLGHEPHWGSIADVTELAPRAIRDLFNLNLFDRQARQRVSPLVSGIIYAGNWDGVYYIAFRNNIQDAVPEVVPTEQNPTPHIGQMLCELMKAVENVLGGTARLIVFYVEPKR